MSSWTPQSNADAADHMFKERKELISKWWGNWNSPKRAEVMSTLIGQCTNKQVHLLQEKLDERFPTDRLDFSRDLPRSLTLKILSKLDPRSLSRCAQVSWYWKFISESDELWRPKCERFGWYPPYKPSQLEHGAWKHFYILKVQESGVKLVPKAEIPNPVESAREAKKTKKKQKPTKVWEPPPWRSNAPRPGDINRNNYLDNSNFKKTRPMTSTHAKSRVSSSAVFSRPGTAKSMSRPKSAMSRQSQTAHSVQQVQRNAPSQLESDTIQNFERVLNSARSVREAPLTQHQLSLTQQLQDIGAAGYANKEVPTLDFTALTVSDNLLQNNDTPIEQLQTATWTHEITS